jgi:undecaprenyl-diphosphatase
MIDIPQFDRIAFTWINTDWSNAIFDVIMPLVTHFGDAAAVWLWIVFIALLMGWQVVRFVKTGQFTSQPRTIVKAVVFSCLYIALIYGVNAAAYNSLKHFFHRSRPFMQQNTILRVSPTTASVLGNDSSFPSGHAANAFMVAALLAKILRRKRYYLYGMAALVAFSRIYLGVHYPGDVFVGGSVGLSITYLMLFVCPLSCRITKENLFVSHN